MTVQEIAFRKDAKKVKEARLLLQGSTLREMLDIAQDAGVDNTATIVGISPTDAAILLGVSRGEKKYANTLQRLGTHYVDSQQGIPDAAIPSLEPEE